MNRTFDMILRNLRNEVNRVVKENTDKDSIINVQNKMISRLNDRIKELEERKVNSFDSTP